MCDEHARMLQGQFNVSMNHLQALAILVSTFHHSKNTSAIDQMMFVRYAERTAFERSLMSGVAYAVRVTHAEREQFERQQGWSIKKMYLSTNQSPGPGDEDLALKEQLELYVVRAQDKVTLDCAVVRVSDLLDAELDPDVKEAFDVAYDNIYAFHVSEKLPKKTVEHMKDNVFVTFVASVQYQLLLDVGLFRTTTGNRVFGALKFVTDVNLAVEATQATGN